MLKFLSEYERLLGVAWRCLLFAAGTVGAIAIAPLNSQKFDLVLANIANIFLKTILNLFLVKVKKIFAQANK